MNPIIEANRRREQLKDVAERDAMLCHPTLSERQLRTLVKAESAQALELAREAGLESPHDTHD